MNGETEDRSEPPDAVEPSTPATGGGEASANATEASAKASDAAAKATGASAKAPEPTGTEAPRSAVLPEPELPGAGTPDGDALRRARALYHLGNYAEMRVVLAPLATSRDPAIADAARELSQRIAVDPIQIGFLIGCLVAIVAIALRYLG